MFKILDKYKASLCLIFILSLGPSFHKQLKSGAERASHVAEVETSNEKFQSRPKKSLSAPISNLGVEPNILKADEEFETQPSSLAIEQVKLLREILTSRNDNDHRLDSKLKVLSTDAKKLFREEYRASPPESRNDRGTIVFLLGRNLSENSDFKFLDGVLSEDLCMSLFNCGQAENINLIEGDTHSDLLLVYPQIVALKSLDDFISTHKKIEHETKSVLLKTLERAASSNSDRVARFGKSLIVKLNPKEI